MTTTSTSARQLKQALADASASQDWKSVIEASRKAFAGAGSAAEIKQLVALPGVDEAFLGEADVGAQVAQALLDRSVSFDPADAAEAFSWLLRAAAFQPLACVAPDRSGFLPKAGVAETLSKASKTFEGWLDDDAPSRRASGALGLCWSNEPHLAAWLELATDARDPLTRSSLLLLLAAHAPAAKGELRQELAALAQTAAKGKPSALSFAACVLGSRLGPLDDALSKAFTQHVLKGTATPPEWGWYGPDRKPIKTSIAALGVLRWAQLADATPLVEGLLKAKRPKVKGDLLQLADALTWSAFEARGTPVPDAGLVAASLDPLQRRVIEALAEQPFQGLVPKRLGVPSHQNAELRDFLAATDLSWAPHPLGDSDKPHFAVLAARVVLGDVTSKSAFKALLESTAAADVVLLACCHSSATAATAEALGPRLTPDAHSEFCLELLEAAEKAGAAVASLLEGFLNPPGNEPYRDRKLWANKPLVACALLDRTKGAPGDALLGYLAKAISAATSPQPLTDRIQKLEPATRAALIAGLKATPNTLPFLALDLSEGSVSKIVRFALGPWGAQEADRVEATLATMGRDVLPLLAAVEPPTVEQQSEVTALGERVRDRLQGSRKKGK